MVKLVPQIQERCDNQREAYEIEVHCFRCCMQSKKSMKKLKPKKNKENKKDTGIQSIATKPENNKMLRH